MASKLGIDYRRGSDHFVAEMAAEIHGGPQVDSAPAEQAAQLLRHVTETKEPHALSWPELNQDVDVALVREPVREHGTKERQLADAVAAAEVGDLGLWDFDLRHRHDSSIMAQIQSRKSSFEGAGMVPLATSMPSAAATLRPASTAASTLATSPVMTTKPLPPRAIARWMRRRVTLAVLTAVSATSMMLAAEKVSMMPRARISDGAISTALAMAGKTDGSSCEMARFSIRAPGARRAPASTAARIEATSPATAIRYLPEQMERARSTSTGAAFSLASRATWPIATLVSSRSPMELRSGMRFDDHRSVDACYDAVDAGVNARAQGSFGGRGQHVSELHALAGAHHPRRCDTGVLAQGQGHAAGRRQAVLERSGVLEFGQAEAGHEAADGHSARIGQWVRLDVLWRSEEDQPLLASGGLRLYTDVLGIEVLGAGEQGAEVALAAVERAGDHAVLGAGEAEGLHGAVRLNGVAEEVAGAEFGAEAALVAGRSADPFDVLPLALVAREERVSSRQDDQAAGGFRDGIVEAGGRLGHHHSAHQHPEIGDRWAAGRGDQMGEGRTHGDPEGHGRLDRAGYGEDLVGHGAIESDVDQGFDVQDHGAGVAGESAGGDDAAGDVVDQNELVAGGVGVGQRENADPRACLSRQGLKDVGVFLLDRDHSFGGSGAFHGDGQAAEHGAGVVGHEPLVLVREGPTLGSVHDDERDLGAELDVGGEACATGADDAELFEAVGHLTDSDREYTGAVRKRQDQSVRGRWWMVDGG